MIANLFAALRAGYELSNSAAWKKGGVAVASLTALISALTGIAVSQGWLPSEIRPETIMQISSGIVAMVGVFLGYVQTATTTKIGLPSPEKCPHQPSESVDESAQNDRADVRSAEFRQSDLERRQRHEEAHAATQPLDPAELSRRVRAGEFAGVRPDAVPTDRKPDPFWSNPQRGPFLD